MPIATKLALDQCNFACDYCWQKPEDRSKIIDTSDFEWKKIFRKMETLYEKYNGEKELVIHGGEVTAYPKTELEALLKKSKEIQGYSAIQTNGYNIDKYIDLFKKYNTSLGVSFDGYEEANILRGFGSKEERLNQARKVADNIFLALENDIQVNAISVITRQNGIKHLDKLKSFLLDLKEKGGSEGRLNPCTITDDISKEKPEYELKMKELIDIYDDLFEFCIDNGLRYSPFKDMSRALQNKARVCTFSPCDFFATGSLIAIHKDGSVGNCVKTYRGNKRLRASEERADIRTQVLKETDCKNCKWFDYCLGGCPNDGINGDWRNKSKYCPLYKHLWEKISNLSDSLDFFVQNEEQKKKYAKTGMIHGDQPHGDSGGKHGDRPHGDRAHGDSK